MKRNFRSAFNALKKMGAPVFENEDGMFISAEDNGDYVWADYYMMGCGFGDLDDFGVSKKVNAALDKHGLFAEWQNPGCLAVCEL